MKKILFLLFLSIFLNHLFSKELNLHEDFKAGDIVSADTFNQIFDTLEKINRAAKDEDLIGSWNCSALNSSPGSADTSGWVKKGFLYFLENSVVTFSPSNLVNGTNYIETPSIREPYNFFSTNPNPFSRKGANKAATGTYILYKGLLVLKPTEDSYADQILSFPIDIVSNDRFILRQGSNDNRISNLVVCDSSNPLPFPPTSATAVNNEDSIKLNWVDSSSNEIGFKVYRKSEGDDSFIFLNSVDGNSYEDTETIEGEKYSYYIVSFNANGESLKSKTIQITRDSIPPTIISTYPANNGQWTLGTYAITITFSEQIVIKCPFSTNPCPSTSAVTISGENSSFTMGDLLESDTYLTSQPIPVGANASYTVTVDKAFIFDLNGNQMTEDYIFNFSDNG